MNWINVKDKLPQHHDIILVCNQKGIGVAVFVDSIKMNENLRMRGYGNEAVDTNKNPYYFCSQEVKQNTYDNVTHWMKLPDKPTDYSETKWQNHTMKKE